jgi:hypothetical protein
VAAQEAQLSFDGDFVTLQERRVVPAGDPDELALGRLLSGAGTGFREHGQVVVADEHE